MALDDGEKLQVAEVVNQEVEKALKKSIPRLIALDALLKPVVAIVGLVVAIPLATVGLKSLVDDSIRKELKKYGTADPDSPIVKLKSGLLSFSKGLQDTFDGQVDSATFRMLRFGCNQSQDYRAAPNFLMCMPKSSTGAAAQARSVVDEFDQSISFAGRPQNQKITLSLALRPVDSPDVLNRVALELEWSPMDVQTAKVKPAGRKKLIVSPTQVSRNKTFVASDGKSIALFGVSDSMEDQPLNLSIDVTDTLKDMEAVLHQLKVRAIPNPVDDSGKSFDGTERFFLRAVVSVNHRVQTAETK